MLRVLSVVLAVLTSTILVAAREPSQAERLGDVAFATSCSGNGKKSFQRGLALLHSFVYEQAEPQFADVFKQDPHCAIALWGEAMSIYYPLWFPPDPTTIRRGQELLEQARNLGAKTERERGYIEALSAFYHGSDTPYEMRTAAYAHAMQNLSAHYPQDHEAAIFYALTLLATTPAKDEPLANRLKAAGILRPLYSKLPNHPGVIHYLIHAYDTPPLAEQGLPMARRYAEVAPSAPHAVHMPSHIFTLLGLWQEDISSNLAAERVGQPEMIKGGLPLHFLDFLSYAYLQIGREDETRKILNRILAGTADLPPMMKNHGRLLTAEIQARLALELRDWSTAASLVPAEGASPGAKTIIYWARTIGSARRGPSAEVQNNLAQLEKLAPSESSNDPLGRAMVLEARAWVAHSQDADDRAIAELREADQLQQNADTTAHDWMGASAREMLADLLLELNRNAEALTEYKAALRLTPRRLDALYGAARAARKADKTSDATSYFGQIEKICQGANSKRPELAEAREFLRRAAQSR